MAQNTDRRRISPPLLYAFRFDHLDDYAEARKEAQILEEEQKRSRTGVFSGRRLGRRGVSEREIRTEVRLHLAALFNTVNLAASVDLSDVEEVSRSIANFGVPDIRRTSFDEVTAEAIERDIVEALRLFEPRLVPGTVRVERERRTSDDEMQVRFRVVADLLCDPAAVPIEFVADVDRDTCGIQMQRL